VEEAEEIWNRESWKEAEYQIDAEVIDPVPRPFPSEISKGKGLGTRLVGDCIRRPCKKEGSWSDPIQGLD